MPGTIRFFSEEILFKVPHPNRIRRWLRNVAESEKRFVNELTYIFCSDEYLHRLNVEFLDHDTFTDIITFDTSDGAQGLKGEMYISVDRVAENAVAFQTLFEQELARVMVHGVLHLCGHGDKTAEEVSFMRHLETQYLSNYQTLL